MENSIIFKHLETGPLAVNCYLLGDKTTKEALVIDPGGHVDNILALLNQYQLQLSTIINTHSHFDHCGGNRDLKDATGARLLVHSLDSDHLGHLTKAALMFGLTVKNSPAPDQMLEHGDQIKVGEITLQVMHTPGHSPGGICLKEEAQKMVFVGDSIFQGSIGRTDFPGCSHSQLINSIKTQIFSLPEDYRLFPGHGPYTDVGREKSYNPFFR